MKIKTKNSKDGITSTVNSTLHKDLILKTPKRSQIRVVEVKKTTYVEALLRQ